VPNNLVRSPEKDLGRQVQVQFAAEWTLARDGLDREFLEAAWNVATALLTGQDEQLSVPANLYGAPRFWGAGTLSRNPIAASVGVRG